MTPVCPRLQTGLQPVCEWLAATEPQLLLLFACPLSLAFYWLRSLAHHARGLDINASLARVGGRDVEELASHVGSD